MFVGHLAIALAGRAASRTTSLAWFVTAACFVDLVWPLLLLAGVEQVRIDPGNTAFTPLAFDSYPWSHSLLMGCAWGAALGFFARTRGVAIAEAWLVAVLVVSHWLLDVVTHRPDLPLWPGEGAVHGFGLWNSIPATFVIEGALWIGAIAWFQRTRRPRGALGHLAFWSFVVTSTLVWSTGPFTPPPADAHALALFALAGIVLVPWAWWIERTSLPAQAWANPSRSR
jgi:hypothetical protein